MGTKPQLFHCLTFLDVDAGIEFVSALGFVERLVVRDEADSSRVVHAQFGWRDNGGIMFGSVRPDDPLGFASRPGQGACNLVFATEAEIDSAVERAVAAGATVVQEPHRPAHGGYSAALRDREGNLWNLDTYAGE